MFRFSRLVAAVAAAVSVSALAACSGAVPITIPTRTVSGATSQAGESQDPSAGAPATSDASKPATSPKAAASTAANKSKSGTAPKGANGKDYCASINDVTQSFANLATTAQQAAPSGNLKALAGGMSSLVESLGRAIAAAPDAKTQKAFQTLITVFQVQQQAAASGDFAAYQEVAKNMSSKEWTDAMSVLNQAKESCG